jgi:phage tail sheath protein FI
MIYWPLKNLFGFIQSSYAATYGNWVSTYDPFIDKNVWIPMSGYAAAVMASTSQETFPWIAPAGFSRGTLLNVSDIGVNPTQKQRDLLYKININPVAFFRNDGYVIFGQKTLYRQPSAFDRINVRRLFLTLEKETQSLLKYFVFEQNSFATRNRLKGALIPIFDQAKLNDGLYDYQLVCDERNNTPDVIDNNELRISIYIKPVRTAEYILADFVATRTGIDFSELIG